MSDKPAPPSLVSVVKLGLQACKAYDRPDLADRLDRTLQRLSEPSIQVVVVGEFKQGKSSLLNALVNANVCPVDDDIATAVPTVVRHGPTGASALVSPASNPEAEPTRREIAVEDVPRFATELEPADPSIVVRGVEITLERKLLAGGLSLVDTPGVGGLGSAHSTATLGALSVAHAAIFVTDASQELTRAEIEFLARARELCPHILGVLTKTDFYPAWRKVADLNAGHLQRQGVELELLPVSSVLRQEAIRRNDKGLNEESGFPRLVEFLRNDVVQQSKDALLNRTRADLASVCEQLGSQFEAELASLTDPERANELVAKLEEAKARADRLKANSARWSSTLSDGVTDLTADTDYDFRQRMRIIVQESEEAIDQGDPADNWDEFEPWLVNRVSHDVVANYTFMSTRANDLSNEVATHFDIDGSALLEDLEAHDPAAALNRVRIDPQADLKETKAGERGLTMMRGSYSGVLMFTMLPGFVPVLAPLSMFAVPIGLLMGRKALKDEKERQIALRRSQAKQAVRKYCDEVNFQVQKDARDNLRRIQRQLRDHYQSRAEELSRSTTEALKAAQTALKTDKSQREGRIRDVQAEIGRIGELRERGQAAVLS